MRNYGVVVGLFKLAFANSGVIGFPVAEPAYARKAALYSIEQPLIGCPELTG